MSENEDFTKKDVVKPKLFKESRVGRRVQPPDRYTPETIVSRRSHFSRGINRTPLSTPRGLSRCISAENLTEYLRSPYKLSELPRRTPEPSVKTRPPPLEWDYSETRDLERTRAYYNLAHIPKGRRLRRKRRLNELGDPLRFSEDNFETSDESDITMGDEDNTSHDQNNRSQNQNNSHHNPPPNPSPTPSNFSPPPPPILRTIHLPEKVDLFKGKRRPNDVSFTEGPALYDWLRTVDNYFTNTGITEDKEKITRLPGYCDPYQGDASKEISQLAREHHNKTYRQLVQAVKDHYADSQLENNFQLLNDANRRSKPIIDDQYQISTLLSSSRDHARMLADAFLDLPFNNESLVDLNDREKEIVATVLKRFIFCNVVGATLPHKVMREVVYQNKNDSDLLGYSSKIKDYVINNCRMKDIEEASRRTHVAPPKEYFPLQQTNVGYKKRGEVHGIEPVVPEESREDYYEEGYEEEPVEEGGLNAIGGGFPRSSAGRGGPRGRGRGTPANRGTRGFHHGQGQRSNVPNQSQPGNNMNQQPYFNSGGVKKKGDAHCYFCYQKTHIFPFCNLRPKAPELRQVGNCPVCYGKFHTKWDHNAVRDNHGPINFNSVCSTCGGIGHSCSYCPSKIREQQQETINRSRNFHLAHKEYAHG